MPTTHTKALTTPQADKLRRLLGERGWEFSQPPYSLWSARKDKTVVVVYEKGPKIVVQGAGSDEFVEFILEPEILGVAEKGYPEVIHPEWFRPHIGIDESGKGDYFGPLVIAGVFGDENVTRRFLDAGVADSKTIGTDKRITQLAEIIRAVPGVACGLVIIGPERYNQLYGHFRNLNHLLAWGHAKVLENLLEQHPDCPEAVSDQFAHPSVLRKALGPKGKSIRLVQRTKAESDPMVAAASILAREKFVSWLQRCGDRLGFPLPKGASNAVKETARRILRERGEEALPKVAKMHFRTSKELPSGQE